MKDRSHLWIRRLCFRGPDIEPASIDLAPGLNVIEGATDSGKTFLLQSVDYMLGAKGPLKDIPELAPFDRIVLWLGVGTDEKFTIRRAIAGGHFLFGAGWLDDLNEADHEKLYDAHRAGRDDSISARLLKLVGIEDALVRTKINEVKPLTFRDFAHLSFVTETEIIKERSPVLSSNYSANPREKSVFKYVLTGVDDSAVVTVKDALDLVDAQKQKVEALSSLLAERKQALAPGEHIAARRAQLENLELQLQRIDTDVREDQSRYSEYSRQQQASERGVLMLRRQIRETARILSRFALLEEHYQTDIERLKAISEASLIFDALHPGKCPFCGAPPSAQRHVKNCEVDDELLQSAANAEIKRIEKLLSDLADTKKRLARSQAAAEKRLEEVGRDAEKAERQARQAYNILSTKRRGIGDLTRDASSLRLELKPADFVDEVKEQLDIAESALKTAEENVPDAPPTALPTAAVTKFASSIEATLAAWQVPDIGRVQWDEGRTDIVTGPRLRGNRGKGMRALTLSAFILTLLLDARRANRPHCGFAFLDTPLRSYQHPDPEEKDISATEVDSDFYRWICNQDVSWQVVIIENNPSPAWVKEKANVIHFTGNPEQARAGLLPPVAAAE